MEYILNDFFVDFKGDTHDFTVAVVVENTNEYGIIVDDIMMASEVRIGLGVSIRNAKDKKNDDLGAKIAIGRAKKFVDNSCIITSKAMMGLITEDSINNLLKHEANYVKQHPGAFISGYNDMEKKYLKKQEDERKRKELTEEEHELFNSIKNASLEFKNLIKESL